MKGRISEWNYERGFGYLEHEGRRVFLHIRDFKERHKQPEDGDVIHFVMGADKQGRPCAQQAVHANDGGRFRVWPILAVAGLLALPGYAVFHVAGLIGVKWAGGWILLVSGVTFVLYAFDKSRAKSGGWREPERLMHLAELIGGWPGAFLAQRWLRHKSSKGPYQFVFILIIGLYQFVAIDALRGWPFINVLAKTAGQFLK